VSLRLHFNTMAGCDPDWLTACTSRTCKDLAEDLASQSLLMLQTTVLADQTVERFRAFGCLGCDGLLHCLRRVQRC
jgi:hypothetical protein